MFFQQANLVLFLRLLLSSSFSSLTYNFIYLWFLGHIPDARNLCLGSQFQFVSLSLGIVEELISFSVIPLVFSLWNSNKIKAKNNFSFLFVSSLVVGLFFSFLVYLFPFFWLKITGVSTDLQKLTMIYLKSLALALPLTILNSFLISCYRYQGKNFYLYYNLYYLFLSLMINFLFFFPSNYSLNLGLRGLAYEKVVMSIASFLFLISGIKSFHFSFSHIKKINYKEALSSFFYVSKGLLWDSIFRNFFYMAGVLYWLNRLGENICGMWFLTSTIFWGIYLLPVLVLVYITQIRVCQYIKQEKCVLIKQLYKKACVSLVVYLLVLIVSFLWIHEKIFLFFDPSKDSREIWEIGNYFLLIYSFYSFAMLLDTFFYATGKTKYIAWQTLLSGVCALVIPIILNRFICLTLSLRHIQILYFFYLAGNLFLSCVFFLREYKFLKIRKNQVK